MFEANLLFRFSAAAPTSLLLYFLQTFDQLRVVGLGGLVEAHQLTLEVVEGSLFDNVRVHVGVQWLFDQAVQFIAKLFEVSLPELKLILLH